LAEKIKRRMKKRGNRTAGSSVTKQACQKKKSKLKVWRGAIYARTKKKKMD